MIVGGVALVLRGSPQSTFDIDLCYDRRRDNLRRLRGALLPFKPHCVARPTISHRVVYVQNVFGFVVSLWTPVTLMFLTALLIVLRSKGRMKRGRAA